MLLDEWGVSLLRIEPPEGSTLRDGLGRLSGSTSAGRLVLRGLCTLSLLSLFSSSVSPLLSDPAVPPPVIPEPAAASGRPVVLAPPVLAPPVVMDDLSSSSVSPLLSVLPAGTARPGAACWIVV